MNCAQIEFLAEEEPVYIVPNFREEVLNFIAGDVGPFIPGAPIKVPLWLAISLRKQNRCRIQCPDWLLVENLRALKKLEKTSGLSVLHKIPEHYMEIAFQILQHASEDIEKVQQVRSLLEDIENLRQHKIREGLHKMAEEEGTEALHFLKLNNASAMEINSIRPILLFTLEKFHKMYLEGTEAILESKNRFEYTPINVNRTMAPQYQRTQDTGVTIDSDDDFEISQADGNRLQRNRD